MCRQISPLSVVSRQRAMRRAPWSRELEAVEALRDGDPDPDDALRETPPDLTLHCNSKNDRLIASFCRQKHDRSYNLKRINNNYSAVISKKSSSCTNRIQRYETLYVFQRNTFNRLI